MWVTRWIAGLGSVLCVGCTEPTLDVVLEMPTTTVASEFVPSCAKAAVVDLYGKNYLTSDANDYTAQCIPIGSATSWDDVHRSIEGKFTAPFPKSGLYGIGVYGIAGDCSTTWVDNDLIFAAESPYIGGDQLVLPVRPNLSCEPVAVKVRAIDIGLLASLKDCSKSFWTGARVALTTLRKMRVFDAVDWWGGQSIGVLDATGLATVTGNMHHSADSCIAVSFYDQGYFAMTCQAPVAQQACAGPGEVEAAVVDPALFGKSLNPSKTSRWGTGTIGIVWSNNAPVANAVVTLDEASKSLGEIVYLDPQAGDRIPERGSQSGTGATGLFMVYTRSFVTISVTANGQTVSRKLGGYTQDYSQAAIIKL